MDLLQRICDDLGVDLKPKEPEQESDEESEMLDTLIADYGNIDITVRKLKVLQPGVWLSR